MAIHESQSLFVEKQLGRNPAFWHWALPLVERHLGETWAIDDILPHVHRVERGLIRVDADEVTYPLHVILRFELEQELVSGTLEAADLPEAWDARMREYLGLSTIDDPADGPMQDVHWPGGAFGYFPSYTLGAMMAAQQWAALTRDAPRGRRRHRARAISTRSTTGGAKASGRRARAGRRRTCSSAPPARSSTPRISPIICADVTATDPTLADVW